VGRDVEEGMGAHRKRRVPQRTCVACRVTRPKRELVRVVRTPDGSVVMDESGKRNGRGAYLCRTQQCWDKALRHGLLERALKVSLSPDSVAEFRIYESELPRELPERTADS
jgi:predicted RNA-binding protein YlxR (DUF448 family)